MLTCAHPYVKLIMIIRDKENFSIFEVHAMVFSFDSDILPMPS